MQVVHILRRRSKKKINKKSAKVKLVPFHKGFFMVLPYGGVAQWYVIPATTTPLEGGALRLE